MFYSLIHYKFDSLELHLHHIGHLSIHFQTVSSILGIIISQNQDLNWDFLNFRLCQIPAIASSKKSSHPRCSHPPHSPIKQDHLHHHLLHSLHYFHAIHIVKKPGYLSLPTPLTHHQHPLQDVHQGGDDGAGPDKVTFSPEDDECSWFSNSLIIYIEMSLIIS